MAGNLKVDGSIFPGGDNLYAGGLDDVPDRARLLEDQGYDGLFSLDTNVDPFFSLLLAAEHTSRIELMTGVAIAFARSPMTVALQTWNLHAQSNGRMILGLGSQVRAHIEKRFSMPWSRPAARMRDYILALRAIWGCWANNTPLNYRGDFYQHTLMTPVFSPPPTGLPDPKIYLGALGPKMVEVAGEVADGLFGHPFITPAFMEQVQLPALTAGLDRSGRTLADFDMPAMIMTITGRDDAEMANADMAIRKLIAFYASTPAYKPPLDLHGWGDLQPRLNTMSKEGRWNEMTGLISDDMVAAFAVKGAPEDVPALIGERCRGLIDRVTLYAPYAADPAIWPGVVRGIQALPGKQA